MLRVDGCYGTHWTSDSILRRDSASDAQSKIDGRPSDFYFSVGRPSEDTSDAFPSHFRQVSLLPTVLPRGLKLSDGVQTPLLLPPRSVPPLAARCRKERDTGIRGHKAVCDCWLSGAAGGGEGRGKKDGGGSAGGGDCSRDKMTPLCSAARGEWAHARPSGAG